VEVFRCPILRFLKCPNNTSLQSSRWRCSSYTLQPYYKSEILWRYLGNPVVPDVKCKKIGICFSYSRSITRDQGRRDGPSRLFPVFPLMLSWGEDVTRYIFDRGIPALSHASRVGASRSSEQNTNLGITIPKCRDASVEVKLKGVGAQTPPALMTPSMATGYSILNENVKARGQYLVIRVHGNDVFPRTLSSNPFYISQH